MRCSRSRALAIKHKITITVALGQSAGTPKLHIDGIFDQRITRQIGIATQLGQLGTVHRCKQINVCARLPPK